MIPVRPPAASASSKTAGSQNRASMCLRCSGGVLMIAFGEYFEFTPIILDFPPRQGAPFRHFRATWLPTGQPKLYCAACAFRESRVNLYNYQARKMGATGFDRNLNDRRDACRATLCSSLKSVGKH